MPRVRKPASPASFDPALHEVWRKAAAGPFRLQVGEKITATRLRHRLYSLRKSLIFYAEDLGQAIQHLRILILVSPTRGDYYLEINKGDTEFASILSEALGHDASLAPDPSIFTEAALPEEPPLSYDEVEKANPYLNPKNLKKLR